MQKHQVEYGDKIIEFELEIKKVKNVNLNIKPDMTIVVSANEKVPIDFIKDFVKKKGAWIIKHIGQFKKVQPERKSIREYVSGESFKYLGKQYRLRVRKDDTDHVKYYRGFIYLYVDDTDNFKKKEKLLNNWYREKANKIFNELLDKTYPVVKKHGIERPELKIRTMKARWGSCLKDTNTILLNFELIKAPKFCIKYVILHELIHFKYEKHNNKFYDFLFTLMPDWEKSKNILDEEIVREL